MTKATGAFITFKITLSSPFNSDNYIEVGVCNFTFQNGTSYFVVNQAFNRWACATTQYNDSVTVFLTVYEHNFAPLVPGETYTFYGYARAKNGQYYCIPFPQEELLVKTPTQSVELTKPEDLTCVQRMQVSGNPNIILKMYASVPDNATALRMEIATSPDSESIIMTKSGKLDAGDGYGYIELSVSPASVYYVRARSGTANNNGTVSYSLPTDFVQVNTPPSNHMFSESVINDNLRLVTSTIYITGINVLRFYTRTPILEYDFDYVTFTIYNNGVPQYITDIDKGQNSITACSDKTVVSLKRSEFTGANVNGVLIRRPATGNYIGSLRVYKTVGSETLQPVDENGDEICANIYLEVTDTVRPEYFEWTYAKTSGGEYNLTAEEWSNLQKNIKLVISYMGGSEKVFSQAIPQHTEVTDTVFNEVIEAINGIGGNLTTVNTGEVLYASLLNDIRDEINSIG